MIGSSKTARFLAGGLALGAVWSVAAQSGPPVAPTAPPAEAQPEAKAAEPAPGWLEGLLYNPAERAKKGAAAAQAGAPRAAAEALDTALRLDPGSDRARYNAGTAHLQAASPEAAPLLEAAAKSADKEVASRAFYNLGNSRLAADDLKGAVEAYKDSLRRDPANADAKFNLELALRRLQEQQSQQKKDQQKQDQQQNQDQQKDKNQQGQGQQKQDQQQQDQQKDQQQQDQQGQQDQQKDQQKDGQGQDQQQQDQQQGDRDQQGQQGQQNPQDPQQRQGQSPPGQQGQKEGPLPQFKDLPDMDAQQAAAILEAIENLERSQRRQDAKKALKANVRGKKDW